MKSALSSFFSHYSNRILVFIVLFLLFLLFTSAAAQFSISEAHHNMLHVERRHHSCHPIATQKPPTICFQLQRICYCPPFPPPADDGHEIDPRYGVEKRLVPSGPNPLHN